MASPLDLCNHSLFQQVSILIRKRPSAVRQKNEENAVHIVLIPVPCFVRGVPAAGAVHTVPFILILEIAVHVRLAQPHLAAGILPADCLQPFKPGGGPRLFLFLSGLPDHLFLFTQMIQKRIQALILRLTQVFLCNFSSLQQRGNAGRTVGCVDFPQADHGFLVARQRIPAVLRHVPEEKRTAPVQQPFHLFFG